MNSLVLAKKIVAKYSSRKPDELSANTRLFHDLGIDGDDAEELLFEVIDEHQVNFDKFIFSDYFGGEVGAGWRHDIYKMFNFFDWPFEIFGWSLADDFKPLTVKDLAIAIENGFLK